MMQTAKRAPDSITLQRPKITAGGIAIIMGISRMSVYRRMREGWLNLDNVPREVTRTATFYDLQAVLERVYPSADRSEITEMIVEFTQAHGRMVR